MQEYQRHVKMQGTLFDPINIAKLMLTQQLGMERSKQLIRTIHGYQNLMWDTYVYALLLQSGSTVYATKEEIENNTVASMVLMLPEDGPHKMYSTPAIQAMEAHDARRQSQSQSKEAAQ